MTDVIEIRDLRVTTIVGVLDHERTTPQDVSVDIAIERPFRAAVQRDDVTATTNYATVVALAEQTVQDGAFYLLETMADHVAAAVLAFDADVTSVTVSVVKLHPPVPQRIGSLGVRTTRTR